MTSAFAQTSTVFPSSSPAPAGTPQEGLAGFIPLLIIFGVFWLLVIRPQSRRMKDQRVMIQNLKRGDEIVTSGGIIGKIDRVVDEGEVTVKIADGITVRLARQSVAALLSKPEPVNENSPPMSSDKKALKNKKEKKASQNTPQGQEEETSADSEQATRKVVD
jgi:preprotein translocase subunit YajC